MMKDIQRIAEAVAPHEEIMSVVRKHKMRVSRNAMMSFIALIMTIVLVFVSVLGIPDLVDGAGLDGATGTRAMIITALILAGLLLFGVAIALEKVDRTAEFASLLCVARDLSNTAIYLKLRQATGMTAAEFAAMLGQKDVVDHIIKVDECRRTGQEVFSLEQAIRANM